MQFNSRRSSVVATRGMVATSQPLAAMAGLQMLMKGGNAVDGAVAAAAALNVVEPMSTGIGGDLFALVWNAGDKSIRALNASGRAPAAANLEELHSQGYTYIPTLSPYAVTVPGCVDGWHTLIEECGAMSLSEVLAPAIQYAMNGYPVSPIIASAFAAGLAKLTRYPLRQRASTQRSRASYGRGTTSARTGSLPRRQSQKGDGTHFTLEGWPDGFPPTSRSGGAG